MHSLKRNIQSWQDEWPFDAKNAQDLNKIHQEKITTRKLNLAEIFGKAPWTAAARLLAERMYDYCQSSKQWSRQMSQAWIAKKTGYCRKTINRALQVLERVGLVKVYRRGLGLTSTYQFCLPNWLNQRINKIPSHNNCKNKQVGQNVSQSNLDLSIIKEYTEFKNSKNERLRIFAKKYPDQPLKEDIYHASHTLFKPKESIPASKHVISSGLAYLKSLFKKA